MCKTFRFSMMILALSCLPPAAALAADEKTCETYANNATSQRVKEAIETCGYSGDMWGTDHLNHYHWCIQNSAHTVKAENDRRDEALKKCDRCKGYAEDAVKAQDFNDPDGKVRAVASGDQIIPPMPCGYRGDAWSYDFKAHARWCARVSEDEARRETDNRKAFGDICSTCREYARNAVVAYHTVWDQCKSFWSNRQMSGDDWSVDHQHHFKWCMGLPAERRAINVDFAGKRRERIVNACIARVTQPLAIQPAAKAATRKRVPAEPKRAATKPVATARKPSADADKPAATKKVPGSGSSAMDRLGGGPSPSGTASGGAGGGTRRAPSAAAQPASSSGSATGGSARPALMINRNAIGGGSPERVR